MPKQSHPFYNTHVTPELPCKYAFLTRTYDFEDQGKPQYKITLQYTPELKEAFEKELEGMRKEASAFLKTWKKPADVKPSAFKLPTMKEVEDDDGNTVFEVCFKIDEINKTTGASNKPTVLDAAKHPVTEAVGTGSRVKVAYRVSPYPQLGGGFSLKLQAVQVLHLEEYGRDAAESFGEEEGGFESKGGEPQQGGSTPDGTSDPDFDDAEVPF